MAKALAARTARPFNTWDALKLLALVLMVIDHIGYFFFPDQMVWRALGRGAAPIFLFLTGFAPNSPLKWDLVVMATLMVAINIVVGGAVLPLNILATILIGRLLVRALEAERLRLNRPHEWLILLIFLFPTALIFQVGSIGLLFVLAGYMARQLARYAPRERGIFMAVTFCLYGILQCWALEMGAVMVLLTFATLAAVAFFCWQLKIKPITLPESFQWASTPLRFTARHMLWIYVIHFGGLQLLLGKAY